MKVVSPINGKSAASMPKLQTKVWMLEQCPACQSKDLSTNYFSGEVFCLKCGLVIY